MKKIVYRTEVDLVLLLTEKLKSYFYMSFPFLLLFFADIQFDNICCLLFFLVYYLGVYLCGFYISMPQHFADGINIRSVG